MIFPDSGISENIPFKEFSLAVNTFTCIHLTDSLCKVKQSKHKFKQLRFKDHLLGSVRVSRFNIFSSKIILYLTFFNYAIVCLLA